MTLVDLNDTAITRVTEAGIETATGMIPCDLIVFATGFDAGRGGLIDMNITGRGGLALAEAWKSEIKAYLGMAVAQFPNMLFAYGRSALQAFPTVRQAPKSRVTGSAIS